MTMRLNGATGAIRRHVAAGLFSGVMLASAASAAAASGPADARRLHRGVEFAVEPTTTRASGWTQRPAYPRAPGMAGLIAGEHKGVLMAAGGANFPGRMPWDGGVKVYYDDIFVHVPGEPGWRAAGRLPEPRAYSAVISTPEGVLALGGENADGVRADVLRLKWDGRAVRVEKAAALPAPRTSAAAVVLDGSVYVAGGYAPGGIRVSSGEFWCLDLAQAAADWRPLPSWPGPARAQAVMAALDGAVYLISGLNMVADAAGKPLPTYLTDAYRYRGDAWERLPDLPWSAVAAPAPAPVMANPARVFVVGGVDGRIVGKVPRDTRVPGDILCFDVSSRSWRLWSERWLDPVVTAPAVAFRGEWWIVSGEIMAGVRTTSVWSWNPEKREE